MKDGWEEERPWPNRAWRWAQANIVMRTGERYNQHDIMKFLSTNKKRYFADLERLGLSQNIYDRFL